MSTLKNQIPNLLTLGNLFSGGMAIASLLLDSCLWVPVLLILLAGLFDLLDGMVARALHAESPIGGDLDSLSDVVSFGVAPMLLVWYLLADKLPTSEYTLLYVAPLLFPVLCGAYRLARFNNITLHTTYFKGMPIPANGIFWVGYAFFVERLLALDVMPPTSLYLVSIFFALVLGLAMVSSRPFLSLKGLTRKTAQGRAILRAWSVLILLLAILLCLLPMRLAIAPFILGYALTSLIVSPHLQEGE